MIFRHSREPRPPGRYLHHRMALFVLGAVAGGAGMATERPGLIYTGIGILALGMILGIIDRRSA